MNAVVSQDIGYCRRRGMLCKPEEVVLPAIMKPLAESSPRWHQGAMPSAEGFSTSGKPAAMNMT